MENRNVEMADDNNHHNHSEQEKQPKKIGLKHGLLMILCCLIPIVLIGMLPLSGLKSVSWTWLLFLLCPLMHIGMMFFMKDHH